KATVEIPSPVEGEIAWIGAEIGEKVAVGAPLVRLRTAGESDADTPAKASADVGAQPVEPEPAREPAADTAAEEVEPKPARAPAPRAVPVGAPPRPAGERPIASPAVRGRAREAGIDLRQVPG